VTSEFEPLIGESQSPNKIEYLWYLHKLIRRNIVRHIKVLPIKALRRKIDKKEFDLTIDLVIMRRPPSWIKSEMTHDGYERAVYASERGETAYFIDKRLAPSETLFMLSHAHRIDWSKYVKLFLEEMKKTEAQKALAHWSYFAPDTQINLYCQEDNPKRCHRSLVRKLMIQKALRKERKDHRQAVDVAAEYTKTLRLAMKKGIRLCKKKSSMRSG